jgi:hypothetical protein
MYEFLAPWGVLVPIISAGICYYLSSNSRRKAMLDEFEFGETDPDASSIDESRRLSAMHG